MEISKIEKINNTIWDILEECNLIKSYEIGGGWALQYIHNNSDSIWDWGIALGKIEDGEFEEETDFRIENYCGTLADILYQGSQIVESMADDIEEYIGKKENFTKLEYVKTRLIPKFKELTGVEVADECLDEDEKGLVHIKPYEGFSGWYFDIDDPKNFWFENIDSYSYHYVDFDKIVEVMKWVAEDIKNYNIN